MNKTITLVFLGTLLANPLAAQQAQTELGSMPT